MLIAARHIEQIKVPIWCNTIIVCEKHVDVEAWHSVGGIAVRQSLFLLLHVCFV